MITQYSVSAEDKTGEFAVKSISAVASAATLLAGTGTNQAATELRTEKESLCSETPKYGNLVKRAIDTLAFLQGYPKVRAEELHGINAPAAAKDTLEFRLKELDASRDAALQMFKAAKKTESKIYSVSLMPTCNSSQTGNDCLGSPQTFTLAKFSKSCGLLSSISEQEKVYLSDILGASKINQTCEDASLISVTLSNPPHLGTVNSNPQRFENIFKATNQRGMYYRIPLTVRTTVLNQDDPILIKDLAIAQFGAVASLPADTGSSNVSYKVTLDPVTGMLLKVGVTSESTNTAVAKEVIDPIASYLAAKRESKDEITELEREEAILKLKKSIKDLKEAVGD